MRQRSFPTWLHPGVAVAVFLVSLFQVCCFDLPWHLRIGEILWKTGRILDCNRFSWTYPDQPWTPTYWLFEAIVYPVFAVAGPAGLVLLKAAILTVGWASLAGHYSHQPWLVAAAGGGMADLPRETGGVNRPIPAVGVSALADWFLLLVFVAAVDVSLFRFMFRPHLFSFLGLCLLVPMLERFRAAPRSRAVWWQVPLLFGLWTNLHSGVVFGFVYFGIFLGAAWLEALCRDWHQLRSPHAWRQQPLLWRGAALFGLAVVASLANPTGAGLFAYVYDHLTMDNVIALEELAPLSLAQHPKAVAVMAWFTVLPILLLAACRRLRLEPALRAVFCIYLLSKGVRFIPKVCIFCIPTVFEAAAAFQTRYPRSVFCQARGLAGWRRQHHARAMFVIVPLAYAAYVHLRVYRLPESCFRSGLGFSSESFPMAVTARLPARLDRGLYNSFSVGGYLTWRSGEGVKVFQDGRIHAYPLDFFRHIEPLRTTSAGCEQLLAEYRITTAVLSKREDPVLATVLGRSRDWRIVAEDSRFLYAERVRAWPTASAPGQ